MKLKSFRENMDDYLIFTRTFLSITGQWPGRINGVFSKFLQCFWIVQHTSIMVPEMIQVYESRNNIDRVIECMPNIAYNGAMLAKFINAVVNQHKMKIVLDKIKEDWRILQDDEQIETLRGSYNTGRLLIIGYLSLVWFILLSYMFIPFTPILLDLINPLNETRPKSPLYIVEFFVDQDKYFYTILAHAYVTSLFGILPAFGNDIFLCNCVHHACGMLTILGNRVRNLLTKRSNKHDLDGQTTYEQAVECVQQHQSIFEFCDNVNKIYRTSFFYVLTLCIVMMSTTGMVTVIKLEENFNDSFRFALFTLAQLFHMFCYNFLGQKLLDQGDQFFYDIYDSDWYLTSKKTKYVVNLMIFRSSTPTKLQASIFPLTLENFTSVVKTSMSYFTVLKSSR